VTPARRLKVLHLLDNLVDHGGAERMAIGLATHLPTDRFEVSMCSTREAEPHVVELLRERGVGHLAIGRRSRLESLHMKHLISLMARERFDVLHTHQFGSNVWGAILGPLLRVPVVVCHEQTWSYEGQPLRRLADGYLIGRSASRFVAVSTRDAERMVSVEHVPAGKVAMIPNAYVPHPASPDVPLREQLGIDSSTPLLTVVSWLRPQKALTVLLDALDIVRREVPDVRLAIAGDGDCRQELEEHTRRLSLEDRVTFLGRRDDVDAILRAADLAVMSSDFEGTPLVAYECMANGTPLVATAVGGLPDIVESGRTGLLVAPRDPAALAEAIIALLTDPDRRAAMAAAAAQRAPEFTIEAAARRFGELYESLWAQRERR
jgi:glycosyltransferase involved in cell wall biosynthesis